MQGRRHGEDRRTESPVEAVIFVVHGKDSAATIKQEQPDLSIRERMVCAAMCVQLMCVNTTCWGGRVVGNCEFSILQPHHATHLASRTCVTVRIVGEPRGCLVSREILSGDAKISMMASFQF